jgi:hypothetical protein
MLNESFVRAWQALTGLFIWNILYRIIYLKHTVQDYLSETYCTGLFIWNILYRIIYLKHTVQDYLSETYCTGLFIWNILYWIIYLKHTVQDYLSETYCTGLFIWNILYSICTCPSLLKYSAKITFDYRTYLREFEAEFKMALACVNKRPQ